MTYEIEFTQYLLPDGRKVPTFFQTEDKEIYDKAQAIITAGYRFECEILRNGVCSFTITDERDEAIELAPNGPAVVDAINKLILEFPLGPAN